MTKHNYLTLLLGLYLLTDHAFAENHALLIGINNYPNLAANQQLRGSDQDVRLAHDLAIKMNYQESQIKTLIDAQATRNGILEQLEGLINHSSTGDRVFIYYSGHGAQTPDQEPLDEVQDNQDEAIAPSDTKQASTPNKAFDNLIIDDEINNILLRLEQKNVEVLFIADSCYSGTITRGVERPSTQPLMIKSISPMANYNSKSGQAHAQTEQQTVGYGQLLDNLSTNPKRIVWSAAADGQLAFVDTDHNRGVFTGALADAISTNPNISNKDLLNEVSNKSSDFCKKRTECANVQHSLIPIANFAENEVMASFIQTSGFSPPPSQVFANFAANAPEPKSLPLHIKQGTTLKLNATFRVDVTNTSSQDGTLLLLDYRANGDLIPLYPNKYQPQASLAVGKTAYIPHNEDAGFTLTASEIGEGELIAVLVNGQIDFSKLSQRNRDIDIIPIQNQQSYLTNLSQQLSITPYAIGRLRYTVKQ